MTKRGTAKGLVSQIKGARLGVRSFIAFVGGAVATHIAGTSEAIESSRTYFRATAEQWADLLDSFDNLVEAHVKWAETVDYDALVGVPVTTTRRASKKVVEALQEEEGTAETPIN